MDYKKRLNKAYVNIDCQFITEAKLFSNGYL